MKDHFETVLKIFGNETIAKNMIYDAAVYIDENEVPASRKSKIYFVEVDSKLYPTKYLLDVAVFLLKKSKVSERIDQNSIEANRFFENLGFITLYKPETGDIQDEEYVSEKEGNTILKTHKSRERDSKLVRKVKANRLQETGKLCCDVCDFDFFKTYGIIGKGYIEAHHLVPVSKLKKGAKTKESDFALVCANCHRMLHNKRDKLLAVSELKSKLK